MREKQSRRSFLGVGIGCAAPLLLGTQVVEAAGRVLSARPQAAPEDPILAHLHAEALRNYRRARAAAGEIGALGGEALRTLAGNAGLLQAYLAGKGQDGRLDAALRQRVGREGRDATTMHLVESYRGVRELVWTSDEVNLPGELDFARAAAALDIVLRKGARRATRLLRQWAEWEAIRADRASGRARPFPVVLGQKPGDDFGGYPDPEFEGWSCGEVTIMLDVMEMVVGGLAMEGEIACAGVLGLLCAAGELIKDAVCG
jgi:hypothetical protein